MVASATSCKHGAPKPPNLPGYQPIINKQAVDQNGQPILINACKKWELDEKQNKWILTGQGPVENCSGIFGLTSDDYVKAEAYSRELQTWIGENCGPENNRQLKKSNSQQ